MEKAIREARGCKDFIAIITYQNNETQIPSHYIYTYTLKGKVINDEFDNINPDKENKEKIESKNKDVMISELDKKAEYIVTKNVPPTSKSEERHPRREER